MGYQFFKNHSMKEKLPNNRGISLVVVLMVMTILLSVIGAGLMFSGINTKIAMNYRTGSKAFNAADTGILAIASTLATTGPTIPPPTEIDNNLCYRFGYRDGSVPSTSPIVKSGTGYSLGSGTGYNTSGYAFYQYPIAVTGYTKVSSCSSVASGAAARVVEARVTYGPVAQ
jgi:hypothetical protein